MLDEFKNIHTGEDRFYDLDLFSWAVGIIEGEGCIRRKDNGSGFIYTVINIKMTDEDVIARIANKFGYKYWKQKHKEKEHYKDIFFTQINGKKAETFLCDAYPYFGERRQSKIRDVLGYTPEPNPDVKFSEWSWSIGLIEGEGSFTLLNKMYPRISLSMTDRDVIYRISKLLQTRNIMSRIQDNRKTLYMIGITNKRARRLMRRMQPFMSKRRQEKIQEVIHTNDSIPSNRSLSPFQVRNIREYFRDNEYQKGDDINIGNQYGVRFSVIRDIRKNKYYQDIQLEDK